MGLSFGTFWDILGHSQNIVSSAFQLLWRSKMSQCPEWRWWKREFLHLLVEPGWHAQIYTVFCVEGHFQDFLCVKTKSVIKWGSVGIQQQTISIKTVSESIVLYCTLQLSSSIFYSFLPSRAKTLVNVYCMDRAGVIKVIVNRKRSVEFFQNFQTKTALQLTFSY